ncbi:DUF397 domain-containing protein [Streptomyces albus subsp. chlorinus]|uniref:DUF397 domain-containing protein n=1 Tax=Streptomyces albus TaxID=1888 RepID=UPI0015707F9C|nr:DUF397 domain-containing protein [Streptomyces albus subsp. chlorinus]
MPDGTFGVVPVRDSKDPSLTPLVFSTAAWAAFVTQVRNRDHRPQFVTDLPRL